MFEKSKFLLRQMRRIARSTLLQEHLIATKHSAEVAALILRDNFLFRDPKYADSRCLVRYGGRVYSQCDEDAINAEIIRRLGNVRKTFVEIGAGDGSENVTRLFLESGWSGVWVEGDLSRVNKARVAFYKELSEGRLKIIHSLVTRENIVRILLENGVEKDFGLLAIDIDMNTSHIWRELNAFRPQVVCIEYNSSYPASMSFEVPYDSSAIWDNSNYFGASLKVLEQIGRAAGYALVGCDFMGVNAFFVQTEEANERFLAPFSAEAHYEPPRYVLASIQSGHPPRKRP